jgi:predicted amidophosphoribosyltransferase
VRLSGRLRVLPLSSEQVLDRLGLDDELSVGRSRRVFDATQLLAQRLLEWYGERCDGITYRSRTTPRTSSNLAFFAWARLSKHVEGRLDERRALLAELTVDDGFTVDLPGW